MKLLIVQLSTGSCSSSLLGPNILLGILLSFSTYIVLLFVLVIHRMKVPSVYFVLINY
jgi:hypothetical protein